MKVLVQILVEVDAKNYVQEYGGTDYGKADEIRDFVRDTALGATQHAFRHIRETVTSVELKEKNR